MWDRVRIIVWWPFVWHMGTDLIVPQKKKPLGTRSGCKIPTWGTSVRSRIDDFRVISVVQVPYPIGSMYAIYCNIYIHLPSIYPLYVSIYTSTMDPMGVVKNNPKPSIFHHWKTTHKSHGEYTSHKSHESHRVKGPWGPLRLRSQLRLMALWLN